MIKDNVSNYNLIFIPHQYGIRWWINIFLKLKINSYSLNESYILVTLDSSNGRSLNSILQVKHILQYFVDMKYIKVQHLTLKIIPKQNNDYSCSVFVCLYSYCASLMTNEDLSKDEWCHYICSYSATYDIRLFRYVIHDFYLRLEYDENSTLHKSGSSSSLLNIHEGIPPIVIQKKIQILC